MALGEIALVKTGDSTATDATGSASVALHHADALTVRVMSSNGDADFVIKGKVTSNAAETTDADLWTITNATATGSVVYYLGFARLASLTVSWSGNTGTVQAFAFVGGGVE